MAKRSAHGAGSLRQRADGRWEARYTYQDELGVTRRGSVYGDTQRECRKKLTAVLKAVDDGTYRKAKRVTIEQWLREWMDTYGANWKPRTREDYQRKAERYIMPVIGSVYLNALTPMQVQRFVNQLSAGKGKQKALSAKSVKNIHGLLHSALRRAVMSGIIPSNPADSTQLPQVKKPDLKPLMDDDIARFLAAIQGDRFERLYLLDLFTGLRQSEILGLQWEDVDLDAGLLHICRQLQRQLSGEYIFLDETKNGKARLVPISSGLVSVLRAQRRQQAMWKIAAGEAWDNPHNLVFTNELGHYIPHPTVYKHFKSIVAKMGRPEVRFHDLRHSCAIMALQAGCSVKAVQDQLGHYSSAFTMDVYAAVSNTMLEDSRQRMEGLLQQARQQQKEAK